MRESAGSIKKAKNGAYIHVLTPNMSSIAPIKTAVSIRDDVDGGKKESSKAEADHLHSVYSFLLEECLKLNPEHGDQLLNRRCLSEATITVNLYASMPNQDALPMVCAAMHERFKDDLNGVPGFYKDESGRWKIPPVKGLVIPVRDIHGRIVALQLRPDATWKSKYLWFSTPPDKFPHGTSSGAPSHFSKPELARNSGFAIITEGALKADIITELSKKAVIGIAGVTSFDAETFGFELEQALPELERIAIAFDSDWREKEPVRSGLKRMIYTLEKTDLTIVVLNWNGNVGKGFDDFIIGATARLAA
jgi:hypothetical protein